MGEKIVKQSAAFMARIRGSGSSLLVTIPIEAVEAMKLKKGEIVSINLSRGI